MYTHRVTRNRNIYCKIINQDVALGWEECTLNRDPKTMQTVNTTCSQQIVCPDIEKCPYKPE